MKLLAFLLIATISAAQQLPTRRTIRSIGEGSATASPDQALIRLTVSTQSPNASEAATLNGSVAANVINELRRVLGGTADIRTVGFSLTPELGSAAAPGGFGATNTIQAVVRDVALMGAALQAGLRGGATLSSITLGYRDPDSVRAQALRLAGQRARAKAEAIAQGLGLRLGNVVLAEEVPELKPDADMRTLQIPVTTPPTFRVGFLPFIGPGEDTITLEVRLSVEFEIIP